LPAGIRREREPEQSLLAAGAHRRRDVEKVGRLKGAAPHDANPSTLLDDELEGGVARILHEGDGLREARGVHASEQLGGRSVPTRLARAR